MLFFRRKTLFHVEETLPDQEELTLRFRRRVLILTFIGLLVVLGIPVARDLQSDLVTRAGARRFAETLLETRLLAARSRAPVALVLSADGQSWHRTFHGAGNDCSGPITGPEQKWSAEIQWKLQSRQENGENHSGHQLCLHPTLGLLLDTIPLLGGKLLITALRPDQKESAYLLVTASGSDLQMVNHWNN